MWRTPDDALLERLEDEDLLARLWRADVGDSAPPPPHPRAAGMIAALRRAGAAADVEALRRAMRPARAVFAPELHHHLALYFGHAARARGPGTTDLYVRSIASWMALADERAYLLALAEGVAGGALPAADIARAAADVPFEALDELGRLGAEGAQAQSAASAAALAALARTADACKIGGCSEAATRAAVRRASSRRAAAVEKALEPIAGALADASAQGALSARGRQELERVTPVWRWADGDESVEQFAVDQTIPIAWELYRAESWDALEKLLGTTHAMVESLALRIEKDRARIAYAAPCAEVLVFRAQLAKALDQQIALAERALAVCPSHRNGRLVLASFLCQGVTSRLRSRLSLLSKADLDRLAADLDRAERLWPDCSRLRDARARLFDARRFSS